VSFDVGCPTNLVKDGSFTSTLFLSTEQVKNLEADPSKVPQFFDFHFAGVTKLIDADCLISSFQNNPHSPLMTITCKPFHFEDKVVILGDAAHTMVPFYGQGLNAGLEDVRILFQLIDSRINVVDALASFSSTRVVDAAAINSLALQNYEEMRGAVMTTSYKLRKTLEETLAKYFPVLGWQTKYARVSFGTERYSHVVSQDRRQEALILSGLILTLACPVIAMGVTNWRKWRS
jgi:kynurenine 3-monooxygenase